MKPCIDKTIEKLWIEIGRTNRELLDNPRVVKLIEILQSADFRMLDSVYFDREIFSNRFFI